MHETAYSTSLGDLLRQAREARGESPADIAHALKLSQRQIEAMELERFDLLPGPAFVRGFLRNYARYLDLHIDDRIAQLQFGDSAQAVRLSPVTNATGQMPVGSGVQRRVVRPALIVVSGMLSVLLAGWYFDWFKMSDIEAVTTSPISREALAPSETAVSPRPSSSQPRTSLPDASPLAMSRPAQEAMSIPSAATATMPAPASTATQSPTVASAPTPEGNSGIAAPSEPSAPDALASSDVAGDTASPAAPAVTDDSSGQAVETSTVEPSTTEAEQALSSQQNEAASDEPTLDGASRLIFSLRGESWIQVRDGEGAALFTGTGAPGTTRTVQGKPPFAIVVGNAGMVSVEFDGEAVDLTPHIRGSGVARMTVR